LTITINNISQVIAFVNTLSNIFLRICLTTYIWYDILGVCIKRRKKLQCSVVPDAIMSGFPVILIKNHECVPILNATAHIGKNPVIESKRGWSKEQGVRAMSVGSCR